MKLKLVPLVAVLGAMLALTGCQSTPKSFYAWNKYTYQLYDYQGQKIDAEAMLQVLLGAIEESKTRNVKVAPGVYAEIGTMYMRLNKPQEAPQYYRLEAENWPESAMLMNALATNVEKMIQQGKKE